MAEKILVFRTGEGWPNRSGRGLPGDQRPAAVVHIVDDIKQNWKFNGQSQKLGPINRHEPRPAAPARLHSLPVRRIGARRKCRRHGFRHHACQGTGGARGLRCRCADARQHGAFGAHRDSAADGGEVDAYARRARLPPLRPGPCEISPWRPGVAHGPPAACQHEIPPGRAAHDAGTGAERTRDGFDRPARWHGDDLCRVRAIGRRRTAHPRYRPADSRRPDGDGARRGGDITRDRVRRCWKSGSRPTAPISWSACPTNIATESGNARTGDFAPASANTWLPFTRSRLRCFTRET